MLPNYSQFIILMGQNNSQPIESRAVLLQSWTALQKQPSVLINRITRQQIQRHFIKILLKDLPRQTALFASRMTNHQPAVCRLLYFHPALPEHSSPYPDKQFRQMYLYTDRMLPLSDWNKQKIILALQALRRLVAVHGPIRVTEHMICENQRNQLKVWVSENPVNNHPDSKYMSEEQTVADIATILTRKNKELASQLLGCHTLRDAAEKLNRSLREHHSPFQNYSHRASESGDFHYKKIQFLEKTPTPVPYRNVFGQTREQQKMKANTLLTPKASPKMYDNYPLSALGRSEEDTKPTSTINHFQKYRQYLSSNNVRAPIDSQQKNSSLFNLSRKVNLQNSLEAKTNLIQQEQTIRTGYKHIPVQTFKRQNSRVTELIHQASSYNNLQTAKAVAGLHRFETSTKLGTNILNQTSYASKGTKSGTWQQYQNPNLTAPGKEGAKKGNSFCGSGSNINKQQAKRGYDITIINNNVSNYISNIVHNHVVNLQKKVPDQFQFRSPKTQQTNNSNISHNNNKNPPNINPVPMNANRGKEKTGYVPVFIQQKKKNSSHWPQEKQSISYKSKSNNNLLRMDSAHSNPQQNSANIYNQQNLKQNKEEVINFTKKQYQNRIQKPLNFSRNYNFNLTPSKFTNNVQMINNYYPKTPTSSNYNSQAFSVFQPPTNSSNQFKTALRTKTTQFYQKGKQAINKGDISMQNKSFTQTQIQRENQHPKDHRLTEKVIPVKLFDQIIEMPPKLNLKLAEKGTIHSNQQKSPEQKKDFKKQLRNQFKFLLGGDAPAKQQQKMQQPKLVKAKSDVIEYKQGRQGQVKQKIIKKQKAFAQLKMQALKVLIDQ